MEITEYKSLLKSEKAWFNQGRLLPFNHFLNKVILFIKVFVINVIRLLFTLIIMVQEKR